jgi:hypothetical protein
LRNIKSNFANCENHPLAVEEAITADPENLPNQDFRDSSASAGSVAARSKVSAPINAHNINRCKKQGSTNPDYLTARIARDRPDILDRMKAGEYPSVRKAALEAGIVKPTITLPIDPVAAG